MEAIKCPNCGANLQVDDKILFCPYCGVGIPKPNKETQHNIFIKNTNNTVIQTPKRVSALDKFLEHRQAMKVIKTEKAIAESAEKRLCMEAKIQAEEEKGRRKKEAAENRLRKQEEEEKRERNKRNTIIICITIIVAIGAILEITTGLISKLGLMIVGLIMLILSDSI